MDQQDQPEKIDPLKLDVVDAAAYTLGDSLGLYLYLQTKLGTRSRGFFESARVKVLLDFGSTSLLKKSLHKINDAQLGRVVFTEDQKSFIFERVFSPTAVPDPPRPTRSMTGTPATGEKISDGKEPPQNPDERGAFSRIDKSSDVVVDLDLNLKSSSTTTKSYDETAEQITLESLVKLATCAPISLSTVRFFLSNSIIECAKLYDTTISIPGHLLHAWQDSLRYDSGNVIHATMRVKNAVLYCLQQKELQCPIKNRVGYFFDAVRRARTPSNIQEKKTALENARPPSRSPEELEKDRAEYWQSLSLAELKDAYRSHKRLGPYGEKSLKWFLEGVSLTKHATAVQAWIQDGAR